MPTYGNTKENKMSVNVGDLQLEIQEVAKFLEESCFGCSTKTVNQVSLSIEMAILKLNQLANQQ